jgi:hypothetical protein
MLRQSLYKKFGKVSMQDAGLVADESQQNPNPFGIPALKAPPAFNSYTTKAQPEGTITDGNQSYGPGTFNTNKAPNTFTPDAGPLMSNTNPANMYDVNQATPQMDQGPLTEKETNKRGVMPPAESPELSAMDKLKAGAKSAWGDFKDNWQDYATLGLTGVSGALNYQDDIRKQQQLQSSIQKRGVDAKPLHDYNWMYGRTTSGGTEYQPTIMAQYGANLTPRYAQGGMNAANVEIEGGEFLILPDGTTEIAKGPSHKNGGIDTVLPEGTKVFSNHLRPMDLHKMKPDQKLGLVNKYMEEGGDMSSGFGIDYLKDLDNLQKLINAGKKTEKTNTSKDDDTNYGSRYKDRTRTFAELAKRYDLKQFQEILDNPFASAVDRQTADILMRRNSQILEQLFRDQQILNGNSNGEPMAQEPQMKNGGISNPGFEALPGYVQAKIMSNMQDGGQYQISKKNGRYYDPSAKKYYKIPGEAEVKRDNDPNIKEGDYVVNADGKIKKFTGRGYEKVTTSKSSQAPDLATGRQELNKWASSSPENQQKVQRANAIIKQGLDNGTITGDDKGNIDFTGNFNVGLEDRMIISEVMNKTGGGFGTDKYRVNKQSATTGYSAPDPKTGKYRGTGSFVAGFTPEMYEQRIAYERAKADGKNHQDALAMATSTDPKQKAENRKFFMQQVGMDPSKLSQEELTSNDFYKDKYADVTRGMETAFGQSGYRPAIGNDALSGFEHFDAAAYKAKNELGDVEQEDGPQEIPQGGSYTIQEAARGKYERQPYPVSQNIPGAYGLAQAQEAFTPAIPEVAAPYVRPQTLNIQSQLQDADNNAIAAMRYGADPNMAYIAGLDSKQKAFQTKQNYDAEGRWKADLYNADAKFKADVYNADAFNSGYNDMYATALSNQSEAKQAAINNLVTNRNKWNQDENLKDFYLNTYGPSLDKKQDQNKLEVTPGATNYSWSSSSSSSGTTPGTTSNLTNSPVTTTTAPSSTGTPPSPPTAGGKPTAPRPQMMTPDMNEMKADESDFGSALSPDELAAMNRTNLNPNLPLSMQYGPKMNNPQGVNLLTLPKSMGGAGAPKPGFAMGGELEEYLNPFKKKKVRGFNRK